MHLTDSPRPSNGRLRVRMEFTVIPKGRTVSGFLTDKKIATLKVLLRERFGTKGEQAARDWMTQCAQDQIDADYARSREEKGGGDAA